MPISARRIAIAIGSNSFLLIRRVKESLLNSTFLCTHGQSMRNARGLDKPQATSEHDPHTNRFVSACLIHCTISDEDCDLQRPSSVAGRRRLAGHRFEPLCGLAAGQHSAFACRWHVHSTADTWNKISASIVRVGARIQLVVASELGLRCPVEGSS